MTVSSENASSFIALLELPVTQAVQLPTHPLRRPQTLRPFLLPQPQSHLAFQQNPNRIRRQVLSLHRRRDLARDECELEFGEGEERAG
jgi:hypothetical protein